MAKSHILLCLLLLLLTYGPVVVESQGASPEGEADSQHAVMPRKAKNHTQIGRELLEAGHVDSAIVEFQKALEISPGYPSAHYHLGLALKAKGRKGRAIREFRTYIQLSSDEPKVRQAQDAIQKLGGIPPKARFQKIHPSST